MGRSETSLTAAQAQEALAYLQRALDRKADLFTGGLKRAERSLAGLRQSGLTLRQADFAAEANVWLKRHLTPEGRRTMLTALRQGRAEARRTEPMRTVRISAKTHEQLSQRANELGLTVAQTIAHLLEAGDGGDPQASTQGAASP